MQQNYNKKRKLNKLKASLLLLMMVCFALPAEAQEVVKMKNGNMTVPSTGYYQFFDSGGEHQQTPMNDPNNEYNWVNMYQHSEVYELTFVPNTTTDQIGVLVTFDYVNINNDWLKVYAGTSSSSGTLIAEFTGDNDYTDGVTGDGVHYSTDGEKLSPYENNGNKLKVQTSGPITFRFESDNRWRDHGWRAKVEGVTAISKPTPPVVLMQKCANALQLFQTSINSSLYYTIGYGSAPNDPVSRDPLSFAEAYTPGQVITIPDNATYPVFVKAIAVAGGNTSDVVTYKFEDALQQPEAPILQLISGTSQVHITTSVYTGSDTYYVRYTTSGEDPTTANPISQDPNGYIEIAQDPDTKMVDAIITITEPCTLKAVKRGTSCPENFSNIVSLQITTVYVPAPTITIVDGGSTTISCSLTNATIKYTTDGSDPTTSTTAQTYSNAFTVAPGTTVKAYAYVGTTGYEPSPVATEIYVPAGGGGVYSGGIVLLDDREEHEWSYYSDATNPIHSLKPADVKITYYGYGDNTMTSDNTDPNNIPNGDFDTEVTSNQVAVNVGEPGNQFIYLKTLENANEAGTGNYPYTMIPNPFQVRPTYGETLIPVTTITYERVTTAPSDWSGTYLLVYQASTSATSGYAFNGTIDSDGNGGTTSISISNGSTISSIGSAAEITVQKTGDYYYVRNGSNYIYTGTSGNSRYYFYQGTSPSGNAYQWSLAVSGGYTAITNRSTSFYFEYGSSYGFFPGNDGANVYLYKKTENTTYSGDYRGFYAWRVKSLSDGLTITDADENTYGVNSIIYADQEIEFVTSNAKGNEVEFEALWAKAWVNADNQDQRAVNSGNYQNAYERNFKTTFANYSFPVTFTSLTPDGLGTVSNFTPGTVSCSSDYKFENLNITDGGNVTYTAAGNDLIFGRGVSGTVNYVRGLGDDSNSNPSNPNYRIRLESGTFNYVSFLKGYYNNQGSASDGSITVSGTVSVKAVLGCDYDRAKKTNSNLGITYNTFMGTNVTISETSNRSNETFILTVKSGNIGSSWTIDNQFNANAQRCLYMSCAANQTNVGHRKLIIEGGQIASVAGGIDENNQGQNNNDVKSFTIRMTGGHVRGAMYGGGARSRASGNRRFAITGGTITGWLGAGCNGETGSGTTYAGETYGKSYVYFGGKAICGGTGSNVTINGSQGGIVFGAGKGIQGSTTSGEMTYGTTVVIADECNVERNVYGGGNYGYALASTAVHVLGGTVQGNVFGGSNENNGPALTVTMKGGTVNGNLYGGSNTTGTISGLATINISGGTVTNVFGGGYGSGTNMAAGTKVTVSGGTINNNVYGGAALGTVTAGGTEVNVSGGTMKDVYGAGKGQTTAPVSTAQITGQTKVNITGGTMANVYGGGEAGDVMGDASAQTQTKVLNVRLYGYHDQRWETNRDRLVITVEDQNGSVLDYRWPRYNPDGGYVDRQITIPCDKLVTCTYTNTAQNGATNIRITITEEGETEPIFDQNGRPSSGVIKTFTLPSDPVPFENEVISTVRIAGGTVSENVFGGGKMGKTGGGVLVNMDNGLVEGSVFGGAFGTKGTVYVAGQRTVNMRGGTVNKNIYGGSRNADDALEFNPTTAFASNTTTTTASVVNFAGGHVYYQVFASGYFGNVYGSTYAFIGANAITSAPHHVVTTDGTYNADYFGDHQALQIDGSVWAGGDFGNYDGTKFGDPTITGNSCVYVDGTDYDTQSTSINNRYMNIAGSLYGCGTSCDAGKGTRQIIVREYGDVVENPDFNAKTAVVEPYLMATRSLYSIQRADILDIDNAHINLLGQGKINSLVTTEHYSMYEFNHVRVSNGSSLFLNAPADQIVKFGSYSVDNVYSSSPTYTKIVHAGTTSTLEDTPNKIRVNEGCYIMIHHDGVAAGGHARTQGYGELEGFAYMMTEGENETCAYARPRQGTDTGNTIPSGYNNPNDGGWVSYNTSYNTFYDSGASGCGTQGTGVKQMPYENHTSNNKNGEQYFRIWRYGDKYLYREGVFVAQSDGTSNFSTTDVTIPLSAPLGSGSYFRIKSLNDGSTTIDYGADVLTVNAAYTEPTIVNNTTINPCDGEHSNWMYFSGSGTTGAFQGGQAYDQSNITEGRTYITNNPNVNFGLVAIPQGSIASQQTLLICENSDEKLAVTKWYNTDQTANGEVLFRLTYNNALTNNVVWDPITIVFEHVDASGQVQEEITVKLTVTTLTNIEQNFTTEAYAIMRGDGTSKAATYTAKVVLPQYIMNVNESGEISHWTCLGVEWNKNDEYGTQFANSFVTSTGNPYLGNDDKFAMTFMPGLNFDQTTGWDEYYQGQPLNAYNWNQTSFVLGKTTARDPIAFDFTLQYDEGMNVTDNKLMGTLTFHMHFTNYKNAASTGYEKDLDISIEVWRIGAGAIYYLDGVHGNNLYSGTYPNAAMKNLSGIFNRTDYRYGDYIFVVNTVTAEGNLEWNGKQYQEVTLLRYPGRHKLADYGDLQETSYWTGYDIANNGCFTGPLVQVGSTEKAGNMTMNGIVLDGFHDRTGDSKLYPQLEGQHYQTGVTAGENPQPVYTDLTWNGTYVNPTSPLAEIKSNSTLSVFGQSKMTGNYNKTNDGGAINNAGTLNIYDGSEISGNAVINGKNGGGVYLNAGSTLQLSDLVTIDNNHVFTETPAGNKAETLGVKNNVYLPTFASTVTVGTATNTDLYTALDNASRVGITSIPEEEWMYQEEEKWYLPVAYSDGGLADYLQNIIDNGIIFDDKNEYDVVSLNNADWSTNPTNYLYFVGTWVTVVKEQPTDFDPSNIDSKEDLAWAISYANGYNDCDAHPNAVFTLTADLDMNEHIWVPIGSTQKPFTGKFDGNGHVVLGLRSPLNNTHMGMFGITEKAEISNLVAKANFAGGTMKNLGTVIGTMNGGTLSNVEAAGTLVGTNSTLNMGGLVGQATKEGEGVTAPVIHSGFAVNEMTGGTNTIVGGLVGTNGGDLYNSYANVTMAEGNNATTLGGLVGVNNSGCNVENCYVINPIGPAFAYTNNGTIKYCYAEDGTTSFVNEGITGLSGHGTFGDVEEDIKSLDYMFYDNLIAANTNTYVGAAGISGYVDNTHAPIWNGLLSALNQWVRQKNGTTSTYSLWNRPINSAINGDLPVLAFPSDNAMATLDSDGKFLQYGTELSGLLTDFNAKEGASSLFHYGTALGVDVAPASTVKVTVNEDAVLVPTVADFTATVGITFDNSCGDNHSTYNWNPLTYDWHFMSSSLQDAPIGATYNTTQSPLWGPVSLTGFEGSYFPNGLSLEGPVPDGQVKWDLYTYFEPQYHWINLKRNSISHWHEDNGEQIEYENETIFVPGKGYMMAISQDSYMNSSGKLNNANVEIDITSLEPEDLEYNLGWNLVGNPYQAYLDLEALFNDEANFYEENNESKPKATQAYVYDADAKVYVPFVTDASDNPVVIQYLHQHQGFFVHSEKDNTTLTFKPSMAKATAAGTYFRGDDDRINYPLVNLFVENAIGIRDLAIVEFNRPELGGATKVNGLRNANFQLAASLEGQRYGLVFTPEGTERVPVHFTTEENGTFTLTWETMHGNFTSLLLVDNMTGTITDMLRTDHYTFDATTEDYASRFYITYTVTGVDEYNEGDGSFAFFDGSEWVVNGKGQLDIVDVTGRVLFSKRLANEHNRVSLNGVANGVYLMRVSDGKNTMVQKIVVK